MNKAVLAAQIAERVGITKSQGDAAVAALVDIVIATLKQGGEVTIAGFGEWSARTRAGRVGVNPQRPTEKIQIPPVRVAKFKAGKVLKESLKVSGAGAAVAAPSIAAAPQQTQPQHPQQ